MKTSSQSQSIIVAVTMAMAAWLLPSLGQAQNQSFDSGAGQWDAGVTQDWDNGTDTWTNGNYANFNNNTVNVSGTVDAEQIIFGGGTTTISGGTIDLYGTTSAYAYILDYSGTNNAISSQLEVGTSGGDQQYYVYNFSGSDLNIGNVDFNTGNGRFQANAYNGGTETFSGKYTISGNATGGSINFGSDTGQGTYNLTSTADFTHFNNTATGAEGSFSLSGSVLNIATSKFDGNQTLGFGSALTGNLVNIQGAQNIALNVYSNQKTDVEPPNAPDDGDGVSNVGTMTFNQSTADQSTWSGSFNTNGASLILEAVTGGRLNFAGSLNNTSATNGITVNAQPGGVVVISSSSNNYNLADGQGSVQGTVAAYLKGGTTLITNNDKNSSAFGSSASPVNLSAGATLGGTGYSTQQVVAAGATSVITAGDPGQANLGIAPTIGQLNLLGGLAATNGLTLDFKLTGDHVFPVFGLENDYINLGAGAFTLGGLVTVNFTTLDTVETASPYILIGGTNNWTEEEGTTFDIHAPTGYGLNMSYGTGGYFFDTGADEFSVEFVAVPEPSTYGLLGLGLLALVVVRRFRRLSACNTPFSNKPRPLKGGRGFLALRMHCFKKVEKCVAYPSASVTSRLTSVCDKISVPKQYLLKSMKNSSQSQSIVVAVTMVIASLLLPTLGHAQSNQTYTGGDGGTWDAGITPDWNGAVWGAGNNAYFNTSGTVDVSGTVSVNYMEFDGGASVTLSGGTIDEIPEANDVTLINDNASGPVTITSQYNLSDIGTSQDGQAFVNNNSGSTLTLGSMDFGPNTLNPSNTRQVRLQLADGSGPIALSGDYTTSGGYGASITFGNNAAGIYDITSTANFSNFNVNTPPASNALGNSFALLGTLNIANSTFLSSQVLSFYATGTANTVNIQGAQIINLGIYNSQKNSGPMVQDGVDGNGNPFFIGLTGQMFFNQSTADLSTWTGSVNQNGSNMVITAVAGGRLVWSGQLGSSTPEGLTIGSLTDPTKTGTVVLANLDGNPYNEEDGDGFVHTSSTVAADLQSGTTLINNTTSGSAFGAASTTAGTPITGGSTTVTEIVKLEAGATLGGSGTSVPQVVAMGPTSVITAGDPGQANLGIAPTISTLNLLGGLAATNGLTLDFKLTGDHSFPVFGIENDYINLGSGAFTLGGLVTVNFTTLDTVETASPYILIGGTNNWTEEEGTTFDVHAPTGYGLNMSYGTGGYFFDTTNDEFSVEFVAVPEPSTYGLLGLGLLALVVVRRFRRLSA